MSLASLCRLLLVCLLLAPFAAGQRRIRFDPFEHLEGYREAYLGDHSDLYDFAAYDDRAEDMLSAEELRELLDRWTAEGERVTLRIARIESDPKERFLYDRERQMRRSHFFRSIEVERVDTFDPIFFYVQKPAKPQAGHAERAAALLGPWARELERIFREEYVEPHELEQRPDYPAYAIVILASEGNYRDYAKAMRTRSLHWAQAHYDPELRLALTYRDAFGAAQGQNTARRPFLHELVHALQHAYAAVDMTQEVWFNEGLAEYLSHHVGDEPRDLRENEVDPDSVEFVTAFTQPGVEAALLPLDELCQQRGYEAAVGAVRKSIRSAGMDLDPQVVLGLIYCQSELWMHFLHHAEEGKYREAVGRYVAATQRGKGGLDTLRECFEGVDFATLRTGYMKYVRQQFEAANPGVELPALAEASARVRGAAAQPAGPFSAAALAPPENDPALRLGELLLMARKGSAAAALEGVESIADADADAEERVARERSRLEGWIELRARFFEHVARSGSKLKMRRDGAWLIAKVERVDGHVVHLGSNRLKVETLDLEQLDGAALVDLMNVSKYDFDDHWLMAYPLALAGRDADAAGFLDGSAEAEALAGDMKEALPALIRSAEIAADLRAVAGTGIPEGDLETAQAAFELARRLLAEEKDVPLVEERSGALVALARLALERQFGEKSLVETLNGDVEELADGRLRITYEFDDEAELEDFRPTEPTYALEGVHELGRATQPGEFRVKKGALRVDGLACRRHVLPLEDASLRYSATLHEPYSSRGGFFQVGLADDGFGNYAACMSFGSLYLIDKSSSTQRQMVGDTPAQFLLETKYHVAVENDGKYLTSKVDGREVARMPVAPRRQGAIFLSCASESPVEFAQLVIEGRLTEGALEAVREGWIERRLTEAGIR